MTAIGYEPHQITVAGETAVVEATFADTVNLVRLRLALRDNDWILLSN